MVLPPNSPARLKQSKGTLTYFEKETTIERHFSALQDPRIERTKEHKLIDIITIAIFSVLAMGESWDAMEEFGEANEEWLKQFLELPNGIPSHDTFNRVFSRLDPDSFRRCFIEWVKSIEPGFGGDIISVDGKTVRGSRDKARGKKAIHLVSAWSSASSLVLGQLKTEAKSNEITAIPKLIELLAIRGCVVTIDAMGCQTAIADTIIEKQGDWVFSLKGNQGTLHEQVKAHFAAQDLDALATKASVFCQTQNQGHGRTEIRRYYYLTDHPLSDYAHQWRGFHGIGMVESIRQQGKKTSTERRYFIASLKTDVQSFAQAVRNHWGIENSLHWVLDVTFSEDASRVRKDHAPENFSILRHIALNLLRQDKSSKKSLKLKRLRAAWDRDYLEQLLGRLETA